MTLPSDFDILRPSSSSTKPCVSTASYGARPRVPQASEQRGMKPAAMLVGAFEIERGRPAQLRPLFQHEGVGRARIEPHLDDVGDLLPLGRVVVRCRETARRRSLYQTSAPARSTAVATRSTTAGVAQRLAGLAIGEDRDRHAPGALPRDAPIRPALDHRLDAVAALRRDPARLVDRRQRLLAADPFAAMPMNHCGVLRKISGAFDRQECG